MLFLALLIGGAFAQDDVIPPGTIIHGAISADLTDQGGSKLAPQLGALLPDTVNVFGLSRTLNCPLDCNSTLVLDVDSPALTATLEDASTWTEPGVMHFALAYKFRLNRPLATTDLTLGNGPTRTCNAAEPCCQADQCPSDTCSIYVPAFAVNVDVPLQITVDDPDGIGGLPPTFLTQVGTVTHDLDQILPGLQPELVCGDPDTPLWLALNTQPVNDLLRDPLDNFLQNELPALLGGLGSILDLFALEEQIDLGGVPVDLALSISDIDVRDGGARIRMDAAMAAQSVAECVAPYDPGGSVFTDHAEPSMLTGLPTDGSPFDLSILIGDDFIAQATYALWQSGSFCFDIDASTLGLDTELLKTAFGDQTEAAMERVFGDDSQPLTIQVLPTRPPEVVFTEGAHARMWLRDLRVRFVAPVHFRDTVLLETAVDLPADITFLFTPHGELGFQFQVAEELVAVHVLENQLLPEAWYELDEGFDGLMGTMVGIALGSFLGDGYVPMVIDGMGPTQGVVAARGDGDYTQVFAVLGATQPGQTQGSIDVLGCLGCDPASCEDCSHAGRRPHRGVFPWWIGVLVLGLGVRRRD